MNVELKQYYIVGLLPLSFVHQNSDILWRLGKDMINVGKCM